MAYSYRISGLTVACDFPLAGAVATEPAVTPDVRVRLADVPQTLEGGAALGPNWDMFGEDFLLRAPRLARFLIRGGREIVIALEDGATARDASAYVLGTAFGILLHQRGALVLHGAAVARGGEAIAICGHSGAGKSTLAAALCRRGWALVTDDLCALSPGDDGRPVIRPDGRQLKLWQEAVEALDLGEQRGEAVLARFEKYFVAPAEVATEATPLRAIYVLRESRPPLTDGIEPLPLPDAMHMLDREAYRPGLRLKMGVRPELVAQSAGMLAHVRMFELTRPRDLARLPETVEALLAHWELAAA